MFRTSSSRTNATSVIANHLMWKDSIARQVGWPSQIIDSSPIISMARDDISVAGVTSER